MAGQPQGKLVTAVRAYASAVVGCSSDHITAVTPFEDGNRHTVCRVSYLDESGGTADVVVRVSYLGDDAARAHAEREARVLEKTGGTAAPVLYDFRGQSPWFETPAMCMEFVRGRQVELHSVSPAEIERLGSLVAWVHRRPTDGLVEPVELAPPGPNVVAPYAQERLEGILATLAWARDPLPGQIRRGLENAADSVERSWEGARENGSFETGEALALLHGDIAPANILWGPEPVLIDWEYARVGDPADEIAYLFDQNALSPYQRESFWNGYRAGTDREAMVSDIIDRVAWWAPLTLLGSALWWVERWVRRCEADSAGQLDPEVPRHPDYYLDQVIRRLDRLEDLLARRR